jgi:RHS repeat-associated protein
MNQSGRASIKPRAIQTGTGLDTFSNNPNGEISSDLVGSYGTSFSYNGADELTSSTYTTASSSSTTSYGFDAEGNRCASVSGTTQPGCATPPGTATTSGYTAYNQLCWTGEGGSSSGEGSCSAPPGGATTYSYNGQGLRVSDTAGQNGTTQNFLYDTETRSGQPLVMMDGTNAYIYGPPTFGSGTAPLEQVPLNGNPISYLMSDQNGVRVLLGALDVVNQAYGYSTYGVRTGNSLLLGTTPFGFQGGYTDPSNLIYYVDRYYDPSTDQFISVDPDVAETGQPYAFTGDDPVNGTDPMGRNCQAPTGDACAVSPAGVFASEPGQSPSQPMTQVQGPSTASQQIDQQVSQFCSGSNASFCQALLEYPAGTPQGDCLRGGPCTVAQGADPVVALSTQAENDALPGYVAKLPPASPMSQPAPSGGFNFFKLFECVEISVDTVGAASLAGTVGTVAVGLAPESGGLSLIGLSSAGGIASGAGAMGFVAYQECSNL